MNKILISTLIMVFAFTLTASATVTTPSNRLTVSKSGDGFGSIIGVNSQTTSYATGTVVTLKATASTGSTFYGWSGTCTGTNVTCTVTLDKSKSVTARFDKIKSGDSSNKKDVKSLSNSNKKDVKSLSNSQKKGADTSCAKRALEKRDSRIIPGIEKYAKDRINSLQKRTSAQKNAYEKEGGERVKAIKASNLARNEAQSEINKELRNIFKSANNAFRLEVRACGYVDNIDQD